MHKNEWCGCLYMCVNFFLCSSAVCLREFVLYVDIARGENYEGE